MNVAAHLVRMAASAKIKSMAMDVSVQSHSQVQTVRHVSMQCNTHP